MLVKRKASNGYILIKKPDHPNCFYNGWILEHRLVMEQSIGRFLKRGEVVHHINGIRDDNRIENLKLCSGHSEHRAQHHPKMFCKLCNSPTSSNGLCGMHYQRYLRANKIGFVPCPKCGKLKAKQMVTAKDGKHLCIECRWPKTQCKLCPKRARVRGLCEYHYNKSISMIPCSKCGKMVWKTGYKSEDGTRMCHACRFNKP